MRRRTNYLPLFNYLNPFQRRLFTMVMTVFPTPRAAVCVLVSGLGFKWRLNGRRRL